MTRIPNIFHFVFGLRVQSEPFHLAYYLCLESCRKVNAPEAIYFYYHHEPYGRYWELARRFVTPVRVSLDPFIANYRYSDPGVAQYKYAHHADFIRLERVLARGGVYADIDTIFVNPIPERLWGHSFVLGREGDIVPRRGEAPRPSLCNAVIMAKPGAEFGRLWLERMKEAFDGSWSAHSTLLPESLRQQFPSLIHVEPQRTFYRFEWSREGLAALLEDCDADLDGVVSIHLWSHLWWSQHRLDFSSFHADRLTERHVRSVDTTYNLIARQHLPPPASLAERVYLMVRSARRLAGSTR